MSRDGAVPSQWLRAATSFALLCSLTLLIASGVGEPRSAAADTPNRAGLVITFSDNTTATRCMDFEGDTITGADLLKASRFPLVMSSYGGLGGGVCRIGDDGCDDPSDCFCKCKGAKCEYWAYYHLSEDGMWEYSHVGASSHRLANGDVDGWAWGAGGAHGGATPELHTIEEICPPLEAPESPEEAEPPAPAVAEAAVQQVTPTVAVQDATPEQSAPETTNEAVPESAPEATGEAIREVLPQQSAREAMGEADRGGDARTALIAFGAVAGALVAVGTGVALLRRRGHG